ncbi:hypothetical protein ACJMK2_034598 [Sinanodonta woodiana]|uniref:Endonuclease/exonuclease/phosphatase domain-containing protein n=1 Tax=Sinanodonta woodiana TaxID=1069815 RepID=A0ABD3WS41_SINWO
MSSSTESKSKGEEKKVNSENNPKDDMPKEDTTVESNSKGDNPKTSPTSEKFKNQTEEEKPFLKVLIMNASGPNQGKEDENPTARRKQTIQNVFNKYNPDLVLFQEFKWKQIHGNKWPSDPIPTYYSLTNGNDARIVYNDTELIVEDLIPITELQRIIDELKTKGKFSKTNPQHFASISRMTLRMVKPMSVPNMKFLCISWHGEHKIKEKLDEFKNLITFLTEIYVKYKKPLLIAGDFNVGIELICQEVKEPFKLWEYEASERRTDTDGVIDYFIASKELQLSDIKPVDLKKDSTADNPEEVLDHDPIIAMLELAPLSDTDPPLDEVTDTNRTTKDFEKLNLSDMTSVDVKEDSKAERSEEDLYHDPIKAILKPAPPSDTAPPLHEVTVQLLMKR